jgi:uridine kinase
MRQGLVALCQFAVALATISLLGFYPIFVAGSLDYLSFANPQLFSVFSAQLTLNGASTIYLGAAAYLLVLGRMCVASSITEKGFFYGVGVLLLTLPLMTQPAPGWYLWASPFVLTFFLNFPLASRQLYGTFLLLYLVYFNLDSLVALFPLGKEGFIANISLTMLQSSVFATAVTIWFFALRQNLPLGYRIKPLALAIAGDSGSGKNRLSAGIAELFGEQHVGTIEGDAYHKWERNHSRWREFTHLSPHANFLQTMGTHTASLLKGQTISQPDYDHGSGTFTAPRQHLPRRTLIVQGLHALYLRGMRRDFDLKIFLNPDDDVRLAWKVQRDVIERRHSVDQVLSSLAKREPDSCEYIKPQQQFADLIIEPFQTSKLKLEEIVTGKTFALGIRYILWNDAPVDRLLACLARYPQITSSVNPLSMNLERIVVTIAGELNQREIVEIARELFPSTKPLTKSRREPRWRSGGDGLNQLLTLLLIEQRFSTN